MSWGIIPGTRNRLPFNKRWCGILQSLLGDEHRVIEECLNGRTTQFEDPNRVARNALDHVQMIMESHSPIDLIIVMLGINDFQDIIAATAQESAEGLTLLINKIKTLSPEPMQRPPQVLVVIPPAIQMPLAAMAEKFSGYMRGLHSESIYLQALDKLDVFTLEAAKYVSLSRIDGIHLDETEHAILAAAITEKVHVIYHLNNT